MEDLIKEFEAREKEFNFTFFATGFEYWDGKASECRFIIEKLTYIQENL